MTKFRASFSVLNMFASGRVDDAINAYLHKPIEVTPQMKEGGEYHRKWEAEIKRTKKLPDVLGGLPLLNPITEKKIVVEVEPWLDLVGVIDCLDETTIYEFKTGSSMNASAYANTMQGPLYGILTALAGIKTDKIVYRHYNQYTGDAQSYYRWITNSSLKDCHSWLITNAQAMNELLQEQGLKE